MFNQVSGQVFILKFYFFNNRVCVYTAQTMSLTGRYKLKTLNGKTFNFFI